MNNYSKNLTGKDSFISYSLEDRLISVVVPAFDEGAALGSVLLRTHRTLQSLGASYEVIVVDDGSTDDTAKVAVQYGARLIANGGNLGKGCALNKGISEAKGQVIITMDADGQNRPEEIPKILNSILDRNADADAVIGSRFVGNIQLGATSWIHILGNKIINIVIFFLTRRWVTDSLSGFRAFRRAVLQSLDLESTGYEIEAEITVKMLKKGFVVKEVPITYSKRLKGSSNLRTFRDGFKILKTLLKISIDRSA